MLSNCKLIGIIPTTDAARARHFYQHILQLPFLEDDGFALIFQAHHALLRIVTIPHFQPAPFTLLGWEVPNLAHNVRELTASGLLFERYPWFQQNELAIWTASNGSQVAWFKDPDGNTLSLSQHTL